MPRGVIPSPNSMSLASAQFATSRSMGIYESNHQNSIWGNSFKVDSSQITGASATVEADVKHGNRLEDVPSAALGSSKRDDQESNKPTDKVLRRLAQNREAARKSRLRKKAYVQQLESGRIKLSQIEQELERARQQGVYIGGNLGDSNLGLSGAVNSGVAVFEMEYGHWVEIQNIQVNELRSALQAHVSEIELRMLVECGMNHYDDLFRIKAIAAKSDVFYLMSGMWKTAAERFFLWIGGFRPSELLKVLSPQLDPLTEQQVIAVHNLQQSSQQAEDALSQGMDKLQQTLAETLTADPLGTSDMANYMGQMANAMGKLEALVSFVTQTSFGSRPCNKCTKFLQHGKRPEAFLFWGIIANAFAPSAPFGLLVLENRPKNILFISIQMRNEGKRKTRHGASQLVHLVRKTVFDDEMGICKY